MKYHAITAHRGVVAQIHTFFGSVLGRGEWLASRPGCFTPEDTALGVLARMQSGPKIRCKRSGEEINPLTGRGGGGVEEPNPSAVYPVA
jgi:hypothetical protein